MNSYFKRVKIGDRRPLTRENVPSKNTKYVQTDFDVGLLCHV